MSQPQKVNTCICSVGPKFVCNGKVQKKSLTGSLWIAFHQTPAQSKANKARVGKTVKCWKSPPRTCVSGFPQPLSDLGSQQLYQAQDHPPSVLSQTSSVVKCQASPPTAPRKSPQHIPWYHSCRLSPNPFVTHQQQSGNALHSRTPQVHCHSQKQTLPEGFNFLCSLFAELLCRYTHPGTFEGKAQFACRPTTRGANYQFLYLQQWVHYTKQFGFQGQCPGLENHWCGERGKEGSQHYCHQESWTVYSFSIPPYACSVINDQLLELERNSPLECLD